MPMGMESPAGSFDSDKLPSTVQPQFQPATTTASRVKCLFLHIDRHFGRPRADAFLVAAKLDRGYLDDETSPIPVEAWFRALTSFTSHWGRVELQRVVASHVHPENLGVWARVLRGAESPTGAFRQLGQLGGEEILTERWETIELDRNHWVGHVLVRADQPEERDGLCCLARASELSSIPMLFGLPPAKIQSETFSSSRPDTLEQRYRVTWGRTDTRLHWLMICGGALIGTAIAALRLLSGPMDVWTAILSLGGTALGYLAGELQRQVRTRSLNNAAQVVRLLALERSVALRETRERRESGLLEGGVVAGQYRLGNKLGVGASGAIWEAIRLSDGRVVAIKLLRAAVAHDTVAADRLRREAAALGLAWHPNVVEVYDDGHLPDGTSYLVMERLYGESLSERLRRVGTIGPTQLLPMALQVCDALGAVHAAGIVHRDLKPSNIFLSKGSPSEALAAAAEQDRVKILDFGIARVEWAETRLTNAGAPLGTPGYMSPEQEQGLEIDARSDLFALGSILFECLTGSPPPMTSAEFRSEPRGPIVDSTVQLAFRQIPDPWRAVIERATDPLPRHRYPDARSMKDALLELRESAPEQHEAAESPK